MADIFKRPSEVFEDECIVFNRENNGHQVGNWREFDIAINPLPPRNPFVTVGTKLASNEKVPWAASLSKINVIPVARGEFLASDFLGFGAKRPCGFWLCGRRLTHAAMEKGSFTGLRPDSSHCRWRADRSILAERYQSIRVVSARSATNQR